MADTGFFWIGKNSKNSEEGVFKVMDCLKKRHGIEKNKKNFSLKIFKINLKLFFSYSKNKVPSYFSHIMVNKFPKNLVRFSVFFQIYFIKKLKP